MRTKYKRRRLWVNAGFQFRLMLRMGLYLLMYIGLVILIGFVFEQMADFGNNLGHKGRGSEQPNFLGRQKHLLLAFVLFLPAILFDLLKFSHRIAGPLYRCQKVMQQMAAGEPVSGFRPRKHDLMPELFQAFNAVIKEWNARCGVGANGYLGAADSTERKTGEMNPSLEDQAVAAL